MYIDRNVSWCSPDISEKIWYLERNLKICAMTREIVWTNEILNKLKICVNSGIIFFIYKGKQIFTFTHFLNYIPWFWYVWCLTFLFCKVLIQRIYGTVNAKVMWMSFLACMLVTSLLLLDFVSWTHFKLTYLSNLIYFKCFSAPITLEMCYRLKCTAN